MAFVDKKDLKTLYSDSKTEAHIWREDYPAFERLMNNDLMEGLDPNLPEVNDGSLAAALFKLPKRIVSSKLAGFAKATDRNEAWITELANMVWKNEIIPNAFMQAPFSRKWKDAVRKAAGYGSVPLITLSIERNGKTYTDFIVAQPQDVTLEPGKVSDYDSDLIFWDVYYSDTQWANLIEQAKEETKEHETNMAAYEKAKVTKPIGTADAEDTDEPPTPINKWDIEGMQKIADGDFKQERSSLDTPRQQADKNTRPKGIKCCITYQRGVNAPFYMYHKETDTAVREWSNPDPTGDIPVHFLYCYQDFINPYGIGIVKLAGGTQNVLDYMRQADVLATQIGIRPPLNIKGSTDGLDIDSLVYAQDAMWFTGSATVTREEMSNAVYTQLPQRVQMYQASLNKLIPMGDTSVSSTAGDPTQSKTPAGVRMAASSLSIDDDDFKDNLFVTYEAVARSMINTHFANMEGSDILKLTDDEKQKLYKLDPEQFAPFMAEPDPETGQVPDTTNELEIIWDDVRAKFTFNIDPSTALTTTDDAQAAELTDIVAAITPSVAYYLSQEGWKFNQGEAYRSLLKKKNVENIDQILTKMTDEEAAEAKKQPFPIIDPPQIRLTGQVPNSAMTAALAQGGVQTDPNANNLPEQMDLGDIYKDPSTGPAAKAAILQMSGLPPDVVQPPLAPVAPDVNAAAPVDPTSQAPMTPTESPAEQAGDIGPEMPQESQEPPQDASQGPAPEEMQANVQAVMQQFGVDEQTALTALAAEHQGFAPEDVIAHLEKLRHHHGVQA